MKMKYIILTLIISLLSVSSVSAQTWYSSDIDTGYVMGANTSNSQNGNGFATDMSNKPLDTTVFRKSNFTDISQLRGMSVDDRKKALDELKSMKFKEKCAVIQKNIDNRKDYFQNSYTAAVSRYQGIIKGLTIMLNKLDEVGIDTTKFKLMISTLEGMVAEFNAKHDTMVANMVKTRAIACDEDGAKEYKIAVQNNMKDLKAEREQILSMRKYIQEQIVNELKSIKDQLLQLKESKETNLNSVDNNNE